KKVGKYLLTDMEQRGIDAVTFFSISRFKGLEWDVVIVFDVEAADNPPYARQLHVAYSRAAQLLYVLHAPGFAALKLSYEPNSSRLLPSRSPR
ncbi:MAG: ATP-binding domain-containing protein, partial [Armatimonadota bacterium]